MHEKCVENKKLKCVYCLIRKTIGFYWKKKDTVPALALHSPKPELTQESMMRNVSLDFPQIKSHQTRDTNSGPSEVR